MRPSPQQMRNAVLELIDASDLCSVLTAIAEVCQEKGDGLSPLAAGAKWCDAGDEVDNVAGNAIIAAVSK